MRLTDLEPRWVGAGGDGIYRRGPSGELVPVPERHGVGITMRCPCGRCESPLFVSFANPIDGGSPHDPRRAAKWTREGDTFETLTLRPSILRSTDKGGCGWHGFITAGEIVNA